MLANVTTAKDASAALDSYNPPQKLYKELKAKLAELRGQGNGPVIEIADGPALKYTPAPARSRPASAMEDPRVPQLRAKLGITENADDTRYDAKVAEAVRKFQEGAEIKPTGVLDDRTVKAINSPKRDKQIDTVLVNMERWRWLPRELGAPSLGDAYVILNIPDYTLKVMQNGAQVWTTRVVTGKPGMHATPLLTETMKYITVNPTWNVPPSIVYNEYLPALQQDPTVLQRMGLQARAEPRRLASTSRSRPAKPTRSAASASTSRTSSWSISTTRRTRTCSPGTSAPSAMAACGCRIRISTPPCCSTSRCRTSATRRNKIRSMYGHSEIDLKFPTPIPVNITYQTAFVDDAGKLQFRKDVYGRDATMMALLKNSRGKDLENVVAHSQPSYSRPADDSAGRRQLCQRQQLRLFGPVVLRAAVRRADRAAGAGRPQRPQQPRRVFTR